MVGQYLGAYSLTFLLMILQITSSLMFKENEQMPILNLCQLETLPFGVSVQSFENDAIRAYNDKRDRAYVSIMPLDDIEYFLHSNAQIVFGDSTYTGTVVYAQQVSTQKICSIIASVKVSHIAQKLQGCFGEAHLSSNSNNFGVYRVKYLWRIKHLNVLAAFTNGLSGSCKIAITDQQFFSEDASKPYASFKD